jgi:hypothetical protein
MKTNLNFHCSTDQVGAFEVLLFLQPVGATENRARDYEYYAWEKFHPAKGSNNTVSLETIYGASVATYKSPFGESTDPVELTLGQAQVVNNVAGSDPFFSMDTQAINKNLVGVVNSTPDKDLWVTWRINKNPVVRTNNTDISKLTPQLTSTFELKQTLYCMFGTYKATDTYNIQTFSNMFSFQIPNDATDVYFEINTIPGTHQLQISQVSTPVAV